MRSALFPIAFTVLTIKLSAQWTLSPQHSAEYECTIGTVDFYEFKAGTKTGSTTIQDTLYFTLRRTIGQKGKQTRIHYKLLKHLEYGSFRAQKPAFEVEFPVDPTGDLLPEYYQNNTAQFDDLTGKIHDFLRLTVLPFPKEAMKKGLKWKMPFQYGIRNWRGMTARSQEVGFEVQYTTPKLGRECHQVLVQCGSPTFGRSLSFSGKVYYDTQTGQLVYLELLGKGTIVDFPVNREKMLKGDSRIRLALLPESTVHQEKTKEFEAAERERMRLMHEYEWVAPPKYHEIKAFNWRHPEFGYLTTLNGKFGVLDQTGKEVLPPEFTYIAPTENGRIFVFREDELWTMYDNLGRIVMDSLSDCELDGNQRTLVRKKGQCLWLGADGTVLARFEEKNGIQYAAWPEDYLQVKEKGLFGILNPDGKEVVPVQYSDITLIRDFKTEVIYFVGRSDNTSFLIDNRGMILDSFEQQIKFSTIMGDLIVITRDFSESTTTLKNFKTGKTFTLPCDDVIALGPGRCACSKTDQSRGETTFVFNYDGLITDTFKRVGIEPRQKMEDGSMRDLIRVVQQVGKDEKVGWMDADGNWIREPGYFIKEPDGYGHFIAFNTAGKMGLLDWDMDTLLPVEYRGLKIMAPNRFLVTTENRQMLLIDKARTKSTPFPGGYSIPDKIMIEGKGYFSLQNNSTKKFSLYDDEMREILKPDFDGIWMAEPYRVPYFIMVNVQGRVGLLKWPGD